MCSQRYITFNRNIGNIAVWHCIEDGAINAIGRSGIICVSRERGRKIGSRARFHFILFFFFLATRFHRAPWKNVRAFVCTMHSRWKLASLSLFVIRMAGKLIDATCAQKSMQVCKAGYILLFYFIYISLHTHTHPHARAQYPREGLLPVYSIFDCPIAREYVSFTLRVKLTHVILYVCISLERLTGETELNLNASRRRRRIQHKCEIVNQWCICVWLTYTQNKESRVVCYVYIVII